MTPTTSVAPTTTPLPTPLPTLSVTAIPTRTPAPAATVTTVPGLLPRGPIPVGWRTYSSRTLSFAIAYPPDWTVDETQAAQKLIYFYAPVPDRSVFVVIGTTGTVEPNGNIDVLRDRWFAARTPDCVRSGLEETDRVTVAGSIFATLGTTCDYPDGLAYIFTGLGLRNQVPWIFEFNAPYAVYDVALANAFAPMLQTLVIADPGSVR